MQRWDVIVIGAGLGGLLTASILARRGWRVLVLERCGHAGGRLRTYDLDGFSVDCGAFLWPNKWLDQAFAGGGVTDFVGSEIPHDQVMRIYMQGLAGKRFSFPWLGRDAASIADTIREVYRMSPAEFGDLGAVLGRLAGASDAETEALLRLPVDTWLHREGIPAAVAGGLRRTLMLFGTYTPGTASIGELARLLQRNRDGGTPAKPEYCGANQIGGVRALVHALCAALERSGAELRLHTTVDEIVVERGKVSGVRVHADTPFQEELAAGAVVSNIPIWNLFELISPNHFPTEFVRNAQAYAAVGGTVSVAYAFDRVPRLRESGEPDRFLGWTRLLTGSDHGFGGGLFWTSHHSPANAPANKHILQGMRLVPRSVLADAEQVRTIVGQFHAMVQEIYADADTSLRWQRAWITRDGSEYMISAAQRPAVQTPLARLYCVGETVDVPGIQMDAAACAALECARLLTE